MNDFKPLIKLLTEVVDKFNGKIPAIQEKLLNKIRMELKDIKLRGNNIATTVENVKKIAAIKAKLQEIVLSKEYIKEVKDYVKAFDKITELQNQYFNQQVQDFKPPAVAAEIRKQAVKSVVENLTERGIGANVLTGIEDILRTNITSGGSYLDMQTALENHLTNNATGDGKLLKYTKQMTTDAVNQYSRQYTQIISSDLGYEWFYYAGSNLTTTRPFCLACTKKRYIHISEFPALLEGDFPEFKEFEGKLYKGLPAGMYEDTTVSTFQTYAGGHNCGHQLRPIHEGQVPPEIVNKLKGSQIYKSKPDGEDPSETEKNNDEPMQKPTIADKILKNSSEEVEKIKKDFKVTVHDDLLGALKKEITFKTTPKSEVYYDPNTEEIVLGAKTRMAKSEYLRETVIAHETGHAIHYHHKIVTSNSTDPKFGAMFRELKRIIKGKESSIQDSLYHEYVNAIGDKNKGEQIAVMYDILGSLTNGAYGGGHSRGYYKTSNGAQAEIFAHAASLYKVKNEYSDVTPELKQVVEEMVSYMSDVLKTIGTQS